MQRHRIAAGLVPESSLFGRVVTQKDVISRDPIFDDVYHSTVVP